jgi:hypothetical protein
MSKRLLLGIGLTTIVLYLWGMLYWGLNPLPYKAWRQTPDDVAAQQALLQHFPQTGTYFVPGLNHDEATLNKLFAAGPIAFVHLTSREGRPVFDTGIMVKGFVLDFVIVLLIAMLLKLAAPALPTYGARVKLVALVGFIAAVVVDGGDVVWWYLPWDWKLQQALYTLSACLVSGLVLAKFAAPAVTAPR